MSIWVERSREYIENTITDKINEKDDSSPKEGWTITVKRAIMKDEATTGSKSKHHSEVFCHE